MRKISKNFKKAVSCLLVIVMMAFLAAGCGNSGSNDADGTADATDATKTSGAQVALLLNTNSAGVNDKGYAQYAWEAVQEWGEENGYTYAYYQPNDGSVESYNEVYNMAIANGAEICICLGFEFVDSIVDAQWEYGDTDFITIDAAGLEAEELNDNIYVTGFNTVEAGFFAGACAVYEGYANMGILTCLDIPPCVKWAYGFIQGANWAAGEYGIEGVSLQHYILGSADASPDVQALATSWYDSGLDLIYANGAGANTSIFAAAEACGKPCIGHDVNQNYESESVLTSSVKNVDVAIKLALTDWSNGQFPGGTSIDFDVDEDAVSLAMDGARTVKFTEDIYTALYEDFKADKDGMRSSLLQYEDVDNVQDLYEKLAKQNISFTNIE